MWPLFSSEAANGGVLYENMFLKISQNSQENMEPLEVFHKKQCQSLFLIKFQAKACRCFPVNFAKFLRTSFL